MTTSQLYIKNLPKKAMFFSESWNILPSILIAGVPFLILGCYQINHGDKLAWRSLKGKGHSICKCSYNKQCCAQNFDCKSRPTVNYTLHRAVIFLHKLSFHYSSLPKPVFYLVFWEWLDLTSPLIQSSPEADNSLLYNQLCN